MNKFDCTNTTISSKFLMDRGVHYGDGLFETIAVRSGIAELLIKHISRLKDSCERLKFINVDFTKIKSDIEHKAIDINKGVIKLIVTRGIGGRGYSIPDNMEATYILLDYPWPQFNSDNWKNGIAIKKCNLVLASQPILAGIKHLNRLENIMAKMELENTIYQEGILCDSEQNVIEGISSNVFIVIKNTILTPKLDKSGVAGVMRDQVIKKIIENHAEIDIQDIPYKILLEADEIFLTNSLIGIWPVAKLNEKIYSKFPITKKLMSTMNIEQHG